MKKLQVIRNINIEKIFYYFAIFWPFIYTINELIGFPSVLLVLISALVTLLYMKDSNVTKFKKILIFIGISIVIQFVLVMTGSSFGNTNKTWILNWCKFVIRWSHLILILYIFTSKAIILKLKQYSINSVKKIFYSSIFIIIIECIYLFLKSGYENVWGDLYFKAFLYNPHTNSYFLILPMTSFLFSYLYLENIKEKIICMVGAVVSLVFNLMTGARTPSIIALVIFAIVIFSFVLKYKNVFLKYKKKVIYATVGIIVILVISFVFNIINFEKIPLVKKTLGVLDQPSGFLNGRNYIWNAMLNYSHKKYSIINYMVGIGLAQSMRINTLLINKTIWAHNDLIETLVGGGLYGLSLYVYVFINYFYKNKSIILGVLMFILLFFNGLFVYSELVTFIPFVTILLNSVFSKRNLTEDDNNKETKE